MSGAKKIEPVFEDPLNAKIQRKFDIVFTPVVPQKAKISNENTSSVFNDDIDFNTGLDDEMSMGNDNGSKGEKDSGLQIDLDFSMDDDTPATPEKPVATQAAAPAGSSGDDDLGFSLDFDVDAQEIETKPEATQATSPIALEDEGFSLDDVIADHDNFDESTKKTVVVNPNNLTNSNLAEFALDSTGSTGSSADLMTTEEAKANMESTIKDILRPKFDDTKETNIEGLEKTHTGALDNIEDSVLDFGGNTPSQGFSLENMIDDNEAFALEPRNNTRSDFAVSSNEATREFDISDMEEIEAVQAEAPAKPELPKAAPVALQSQPEPVRQAVIEEPVSSFVPGAGLGGQSLSTEDSMRFQATIRALREEREELLSQIKTLKADSKEFEQDNLTLKANLDEAKIEITILRKRHMVELEDLKYRLTMSEEKKALADEKARQAELRREKLEQKVRIDFNQVKQREKELESKLELLSMDVDSQVQSRDQKILELRRKIDALEFNMENASIKEQKSLEDKRKLEDRLGKIMKTLRHSIKNLEDDIDHVEEDDDHQKEKN
ncbi:hypothetical protein DOM21_07435 [Bacteriovorax stolpii]|uniref:Uncharacterized protein n=2 Tax=Bacteriovorax stolpii TaxID=960 RepID=A0A2K9NT84_BACTC|nr:hypothetical protein [Bacteriovorax stolpii]AUN98730.1 hypothetical protein C0V70_11585 [Bacteriovorax stolpii]QDK41290.1 hypothetical protein DOM21_07435 [Bacteriovorax stolpii]TDP55756.1 hypothetical protein C8D79_0813 [Bacteriovorax stolpii]